MKKLLCLGFTALMMLFAVPNVWAQDEGTEDPNYIVEFMDAATYESLEETGTNSVVLNYPSIMVTPYGAKYAPVDAEIYYVLLAEGETDVEPTRANYEAEGNTKVKKAIAQEMSTSGYDFGVGGSMSVYMIYPDNAAAKTLKVKCYLTPKATPEPTEPEGPEVPELLADGDAETVEEIVTETFTFTISVGTASLTAPALSPANGEVHLGDNITITNMDAVAGEATQVGTFMEREGEIFYTIDGTAPLYGISQVYDEEAGIAVDGSIGETFTVKVMAFKKDADAGTVAVSEVVTATYSIVAVPQDNPTLTVTPVNGTKGENDVYTFNGMAKFTTAVTDLPQGKELNGYAIKVYVDNGSTGADYQLIEMEFDAEGTVELTGIYNGDYTVDIVLCEKITEGANEGTLEELDVKETFVIKVTNYEEVVEAIPTLTVAIASNGTMGTDNKVTFNGMAKFTTAVTNLPQGKELSNYSIKVTVDDGQTGADYQPIEMEFDATATAANVELNGIYNGNYEVIFTLCEKITAGPNAGKLDELEADTTFNIIITNYAEPVKYPAPKLAVALGTNGTMANGVVTFDSIPTFKMKVTEVAEGDALSNYAINMEIYEKDSVPTLATVSYEAADTAAQLVGIYNGDYNVVFYLERKADENIQQAKPEHLESTDTTFTIKVTNYAEPAKMPAPKLAVTAGANGTTANDMVTFDGMAKFTMAVSELAQGDNLANYTIEVEVYEKDSVAVFAALSYDAVDTVAQLGGVYNGDYDVLFYLQRKAAESIVQAKPEHLESTDVTFTIKVTNYEEVVDIYTVTIKPVGATMTGDKAAYNGNVVFDILVGGLQVADSNMSVVTTIFTPAEYADTIAIEPKSTVKAADSVRFETSMSNGEYVALVELVRAGNREDMVVEFATLNLTVGGAAIEYSELAGVNVYPNPSNGTFNVAVPEKARIDIFGLNGAKVMSREANAGVETFSINHSGIYFVRVMAGNKAAVKRVVVR